MLPISDQELIETIHQQCIAIGNVSDCAEPSTSSKPDVPSRPSLSGDYLHILYVIYRFTLHLAFNM